jgi:hypothetical protein
MVALSLSLLVVRSLFCDAFARAAEEGLAPSSKGFRSLLARVWAGVEIADAGGIEATWMPDVFLVRSRGGEGHHLVGLSLDKKTLACSCADHRYRAATCAHIRALEYKQGILSLTSRRWRAA